MGNFSRFVRPGFRRITTKTAPPDGVLLSAHRNPADGTVVVVAANTTATATTLSLFIPGTPACSYTPYVTSESESLAQRTAVTVSSGRLSLSLPPLSVTSLVGQP